MRERTLIGLLLLVSVLVSGATTDRAYAAEAMDAIAAGEGGGGSSSQPLTGAVGQVRWRPRLLLRPYSRRERSELEELRAFAWLDPAALGPALASAIDAGLEAIGEAIGGASAGKPLQMHHFATNKNERFTSDMQRIASKYGLDLDGDWNKERLPQQGRHVSEYHAWVLDRMEEIDQIARGDRQIFLHRFETDVKAVVRANPKMLYSAYWQ